MAFGRFQDQSQSAPMAEINVTPMIDVMLVLLVIFILTAPLFTQAIKLELPQASGTAGSATPQAITLSINSGGVIYWDKEALELPLLEARLAEVARQTPQPELQLRADKASRYEMIAMVMAAAQKAGIQRIGFVTQPVDQKQASGKP